jgi:hypothetical protein
MIYHKRDPRMAAGPLSMGRAAELLRNLGFLVLSPFPEQTGDSRLLVALRERPTKQHYDPELVRYWRTSAEGRGTPAELKVTTHTPLATPFSWGTIELVDRLGVVNDFVTLGGTLSFDAREGTRIAIFRSPGPIYRMGGHSQRIDPTAPELGAFFARMMVAIDFEPGVEEAISAASPLERYAAFIAYEDARHRASLALREQQPRIAAGLIEEAMHLEAKSPNVWASGLRLLEIMGLWPSSGRPRDLRGDAAPEDDEPSARAGTD